MTKAEIEQKVQELHSGHKVDAASVAEIQQFLESLPEDERIYATAYGARLAEEANQSLPATGDAGA